ncbi:hypothetical protein G6O69_08980 [Pseudenhygromyxa sp. WMMC2535]|uniref:hypothetical protein n=1 Tax=Pseudenhygromyxa sp. WMMC2535 TaxID=2712867 RepID=UPI001557AD49|nr:hypothetical protein [Pseudenhygromyxa sp. WMMC2535]NVB37968.1 hypothetical protein [Pseudenhygromyxa sp. WMMC2535]
MSSQTVRVELREATLSESATLHEGEATFIALDCPPPVRSLLRVVVDDDPRAFEVHRVVEVVGEGEARRGCYGAFVEAARFDEQNKVGSEHLEPGISNSGVPAPVVIMNTGDMMLGAEAEDEQSDAASSGEDSSEGSDSSEAESSGSSEGEGSDSGEGDSSEGDSSDGDSSDGDSSDGDSSDGDSSDGEEAPRDGE